MNGERWPDHVQPNGQPWIAVPRSGSGVEMPRQTRSGASPAMVGTGAPHRRTDDRGPVDDGNLDSGRSSAELIASLIASVFLAVMVVLGAYGFLVLLFVQ